MTIETLITLARSRLFDPVAPFKWMDTELTAYFNEAEREACKRAHLIVDRDTAAYCKIALVSYQGRYALDPKVLQVKGAFLGPKLKGTTYSWDSTTRTLGDSGNGFLTAGFSEDKNIMVSGFTSSENNGLFTVSSVAAGAIVVNETTMATEAAGDTVTIWEDQVPLTQVSLDDLTDRLGSFSHLYGTPEAFYVEENGYVSFVPIPDAANIVSLSVSRLPAADISAGLSPEIPEMYQFGLVDYACYLANLKDGEQTYNPGRAGIFEREFTSKFGRRPTAVLQQVKRTKPKDLSVRWREFGI